MNLFQALEGGDFLGSTTQDRIVINLDKMLLEKLNKLLVQYWYLGRLKVKYATNCKSALRLS